jgi:ubiquinone/menaquinone biosynthesis C-methylase UbiE
MIPTLQHDMRPELSTDEHARQRFVSGLRRFVLNDLAGDMRRAFETRVAPSYQRAHGHAPATGAEAHAAIRPDPAFKIYSAVRVTAQKLVWESVQPSVERDADKIESFVAARGDAKVRLDPALPIPRNVHAIDVHFMPGSYSSGEHDPDPRRGALYDRSLAVFGMGLMGKNSDDIGLSMSRYISRHFPDFKPARILDLGCTIGHNTLPWKQTYPSAEVIGTDVAAGCLRYAAARASAQGVDVRFEQMNAESIALPDESVDLVFTSMFLHELSPKTIRRVFAEIRRVLRPGGMMVHMELPPNEAMGAYDSFYMDWDCYYNVEPFYKAYRDQSPSRLCAEAGFPAENYFQFVAPSMGFYGADAIDAAARASSTSVQGDLTGRLEQGGIQWFGFGAIKEGRA